MMLPWLAAYLINKYANLCNETFCQYLSKWHKLMLSKDILKTTRNNRRYIDY